MNKEKYICPVVEVSAISQRDILLNSDTLIDGKHLFEEETEDPT